MTRVWDYQPVPNMQSEWAAHANWLAQAINNGRPRAEMDEYMGRAQMLMRIGGSMSFRKVVDRSIEVLSARSRTPMSDRIDKLDPTVA